MQSSHEAASIGYPIVTIRYYDHISAAEIAPLVDELGSHCFEVHTERQLEPAMAQTWVDVAALCIQFAGQHVLQGMLNEIGKQAWQKIGPMLYKLYKRAPEGQGYRYMRTFALETFLDRVLVTFRITGNSMSPEQFDAALEAARRTIEADDFDSRVRLEAEDGRHFIVGWDQKMGVWYTAKMYDQI